MRYLLCGVAALALVAPAAAQDEKPKGATVAGAFESFKDGTLTIKVTGKKGDAPVATEIKLPDDLKATVFVGEEKKEVALKDAFKDLKAGAPVSVLKEGDKVVGVTVGAAPKKPGEKKVGAESGAFESFKDGTLTLKVAPKKGDVPLTVEIKVGAEAKVSVYDGKEKKEVALKDAFKDVKPGTAVTVVKEGDKVTEITVGAPPNPKKPEEKKGATVAGAFESFKDGTLTIKAGKKGEEAKPVEIKVGADAKVSVYEGKEKKDVGLKDAFKDLKVGTMVTVVKEGDKVTEITVGAPAKK